MEKGGYSDVKGCPTNIVCRAPIVNTCLSISRMLIHAHRLRYIFNFTEGIAYHVNVINVIHTNKERTFEDAVVSLQRDFLNKELLERFKAGGNAVEHALGINTANKNAGVEIALATCTP